MLTGVGTAEMLGSSPIAGAASLHRAHHICHVGFCVVGRASALYLPHSFPMWTVTLD